MSAKVQYCYDDGDEVFIQGGTSSKHRARSTGLNGRSQSLKDLNIRYEDSPVLLDCEYSRDSVAAGGPEGDIGAYRCGTGRPSHHPNNVSKKTYLGGRIARKIQSWENSEQVIHGAALSRSKSEKSLLAQDDPPGFVNAYGGRRSQSHKDVSGKKSESGADHVLVWRITSSSSWDERRENSAHVTEASSEVLHVKTRTRSELDVKMPYSDPTSADAEWKKIQQNTFTRWCNEHLKCVNMYIHNLETDLCDGLKLIALLQVLSGKKLPRHNKKPNFQSQKMENVSIALKFIQQENIRLVNIDSSDIVKGNLKLILGLIWTLILKYQISMPYMDDEPEAGGQKMTPKQALLSWVKSKMPESVPMDNFTNHWNDGRAVACLVDAVAPGLLPECEDLDPKDALENATNAMALARDWLDVPTVLDPADMVNPKVDELSVMTYISYFPEAKCKPGAPLRPRVHPSAKCYATGPGVEPKGLVCKKRAEFTVFTQGAGMGKLGVQVWGPGKKEVEVFVQDNNDHTFSCYYIPAGVGKYDLHIKWNGRHIPKSPYRVEVSADLDASKAYAKGPGLEPRGIVAGKYTDFTVYTKDAGEGQVTVKVIDPRGGEDVDVIIEPQEEGEYFVEYQPVNTGKHTIKVMYGGQHIAASPFHVTVDAPKVEPIPSKVKVYGAGVEPSGLKSGQRAPFTVDTRGAGDGELDVFVEGPHGEEKVDVKSNGDGTYSCCYFPPKFGKYVVTVTWSGTQVPNSPFTVKVATPVDASRIRAYGPGLERGSTDSPCQFTVETKGAGIDSLGFAIEGPSQAEIKCVDQGGGVCHVTYFPRVPGTYAVHVTCGDVDIPNSPFMVPISPPGDVNLVYAEGPGLEPEGVVAGVPAEFTVYTDQSGPGLVDVKVVDGNGRKAKVDIKDNKDNTHTVTYYPEKPGLYTVSITFNGQTIPKSPFRINIGATNPAKCRAYGPGLEKGLVHKPNNFKIETKGAGEGSLGLTIEGPSEAKIECKDNGDGSCDVTYWPSDPGSYTINILFADQHIPESPFHASIAYPLDPSKVKVEGPGIEPGVRAGEPAEIDVETRLAGDAPLYVDVVDDLNETVPCEVDEEEYGMHAITYHPKKSGPHEVTIMYGGEHVPGSPFKVPISPKSDASKVKVTGPGVEPGGVEPGKPTWFDIDTQDAGKGDARVKVQPVGQGARPVSEVAVEEIKPNVFQCAYTAPDEGDYEVDVTFDDEPVRGSPFPVQVARPCDASKCVAQGDGLEKAVIDQLAEFDVDCSKAGEGELEAKVTNPSGAETDTLVTDNEDGSYSVSYTPTEEGVHDVDVKYGGKPIPGSPFKARVLPPTDPTRCKAYGPGLERAVVDEPAEFTVETRGAGEGGLSLAIEGPSEAKLNCTDNGDGTCSASYVPVEPGEYSIHIKFADEHIPGSPFFARVTEPVDVRKVKCYGPGLDRTTPLYSTVPQLFTVDATETAPADVDVTIETPDKKFIKPDEIRDKGNGLYDVLYTPDDQGRYAVDVKYADQRVPNSPFRVRAGPPFDASKVSVTGPGVDGTPVAEEVAPFTCDVTEAGVAPLSATVTPPSGRPITPDIKDNGDGTYTVEYVPDEPGPYAVDVKYGDERVPGSPFKVQALPGADPSRVKVEGLGPEEEIVAGKEHDFDIDATKAGVGLPLVEITGPSGARVPAETVDNNDGTFTCMYTPQEPGVHSYDVDYAGEPVPGSPFKANVEPAPDASKVKVDGLMPGELVPVGKPHDFDIDASETGKAEPEVAIKAPSGKRLPVEITDNEDGTHTCEFVPQEEGRHEVDVKYGGDTVPGSPYSFKATPEEPPVDEQIIAAADDRQVESMPDWPDAPGDGKVRAYGKGLERGIAHEPCEFTVVTRDAGPGGLSLSVEGPSKAVITCQDNGDGTCSVQYMPEEPGDYNINVKFADEHIEGSPFVAHIYSSCDDVDTAQPRPTVGKPCDVGLNIPDIVSPGDLKRLEATLQRPGSRREEPIDLFMNPDGTLGVTFTPYEPGEHLIHVRKDGREVQNSPFSVLVQAQRIGDVYPVGHTCDLGIKVPEDADELVATLRRPNSSVEEPLKVSGKLEDDTLDVSFVPKEPGEHFLSVKNKKDNTHIPGSPFSILVEAVEPVEAVGCPVDYALDIPGVNMPQDFEKLKGTLKRPSSKIEEPLTLKLNSDNSLSVSFVPQETGVHYINVTKFGRHVPGSPFEVDVTSDEPARTVGKPLGKGLDSPDVNLPEDYPQLTAALKRPSSKKEEPVRLILNGDNTLSVAFTPREVGEHLLHLRKDGRDVQDSPFVIMVVDKDKVEEVHPMGKTCDVNLDIPGVNLPEDLQEGRLKAYLMRPSSTKEEPLDLELNPDNTLGVSFVPDEPGEHKISVRKMGEDVPGSPFSVMVEAAEAVNAVGRPCDALLDIPNLRLPEDVDSGKLVATLKRPSSNQEEPVKLKVTSDKKLCVSFVPREPGEHLISVKKYNRHVDKSPFSVMVVAPEEGNSIGRPCGVGLEIPGLVLPEDYTRLSATLRRPGSSAEEPLKLGLNSDNTLSVSFTPQETGEHFITVKKDGRHVTGSPFSVMVSGPGPADPRKVKVTGDGLKKGEAGKPAYFTVDTRDAGYGGLGLAIEGPSKAQINCTDNEDGTCSVEYLPEVPGKYSINVKFADEDVPGSPFAAKIRPAGAPEPAEDEIVVADQGQDNYASPDFGDGPTQRVSEVFEDLVTFGGTGAAQPQDFAFDLKGFDVDDLETTVVSPDGEILESEIIAQPSEDTYTIRFLPKESGEHTINVKYRSRRTHIPGSPFKVFVEAPVWGGASKCTAAGPGLERGVVGHPGEFTVWTRDAGPGGLAIAVEGPAKAEITCKDNGDGSCDITYLPTAPGDYTVHIRFADEDIPDSPFKVHISPEVEEMFRDLTSDLAEADSGLKVGQPASFSVQTNADVQNVTASVLAPSGTETKASVSDLGDGNFAIRFVPREYGDHLVNVRFDDVHIPGSPFKIRVGGAEGHPEKVKAFGPGLSSGCVGEPAQFTVNALEAGSGALALSVDGPAKVKMNCSENPDGTYNVTYNPVVPGDYTISIKFAGQHIPGSPYNVRVGAAPGSTSDASKCTSRGTGLTRPVLGKSNTFTVNASEAGRGSLMVGVEGPAIPAKEITVRHTGLNVYAVNYALENPGNYILKVLWADKHIPGSPFHVSV